MKYHAIIEKSEGWGIGWLVDLPGVNSPERTRKELLESLKIAAKDIQDLKGIHDPNVEIVVSSATVPRISPSECPCMEPECLNNQGDWESSA